MRQFLSPPGTFLGTPDAQIPTRSLAEDSARNVGGLSFGICWEWVVVVQDSGRNGRRLREAAVPAGGHRLNRSSSRVRWSGCLRLQRRPDHFGPRKETCLDAARRSVPDRPLPRRVLLPAPVRARRTRRRCIRHHDSRALQPGGPSHPNWSRHIHPLDPRLLVLVVSCRVVCGGFQDTFGTWKSSLES